MADEESLSGDLDDVLTDIQADLAAGSLGSLAEYATRAPRRGKEIASAYLAAEQTAGGKSGEGRIGNYRLIEELGRGGQGVVWLAEDTRLRRKVALKVLTDISLTSPEILMRFRREAEVTSRLDHPGICTVFDTGIDAATPWIAMRFVAGQTLAEKIYESKKDEGFSRSTYVILDETEAPEPETEPVSPASPSAVSTVEDLMKAVALVERAARALHAAHEAGVIHRDIKPGNIMVATDGEPVIVDFGLARTMEGDLPTLTQTGQFFGTPAYMSPEQLLAHRVQLDRRTDVWSLGVVLYECLTLKRAFDAPTREGLYQAIQSREPDDARELNPEIPRDLQVVLETALDKDRDRRYQTAEEFAEDLRRVREHEPIHARPAGRWVRMKRWGQRNPALATAVVSLFFVLISGLGVTAWFLSESQAALGREREALGRERIARKEADAERARADENLAAYERLSDEFKLEELVAEAENALWPAAPEKIAEIKAWLKRARALASGLPSLEANLEDLREKALPLTPEIKRADRAAQASKFEEWNGLESEAAYLEQQVKALEASDSPRAEKHLEKVEERLGEIADRKAALEPLLSQRLTWEFADAKDRWRHDRLAAFVDALRTLTAANPFGATIASVEDRLAFAEGIRRRSLDDHAAAWDTAVEGIAASPHYRGMPRLRPQVGFVPIGADPDSGLWEFAHLRTGSIPRRHETTGKLELTEEFGLVFVLIPGGTFTMGAQSVDEAGPNYDPQAHEKEGPPHEVTLAPFFLSKYEMTQGQWQRFTGTNPSNYPPSRQINDKATTLIHPVEKVSWDECDRVLGRLGLVLPTEAQWEYACRAGTTTSWWTGQDRESLRGAINLADRSAQRSGAPWPDIGDWPDYDDGYAAHAPVGIYRANRFGLHDVHGNVYEWCRDWSVPYELEVRAGDGLREAPRARHRVVRGGSFGLAAHTARSACRFGSRTPDFRFFALGLRPAMATN